MLFPGSILRKFQTLAYSLRPSPASLRSLLVTILGVWALSLGAFPAVAEETHGRASLRIAADTLPLTPEIDRLDVHFVLRSEGWRVAVIQPAASLGHADTVSSVARHWELAHLQIVVSDIDADQDLDVIVVNRLSGLAQSVWRNHGDGFFERLRGDRFGATPFSDDRISSTTKLSGPSVSRAVNAPDFWLWTTGQANLYRHAELLSRVIVSPLAAAFLLPCRGRAPPPFFLS